MSYTIKTVTNGTINNYIQKYINFYISNKQSVSNIHNKNML